MPASRRFALRRRQNLVASLRHSGWLLLVGALALVCTVAPLYLGWWDTAVPAAIGSAIAVVLFFAVAVNTPLEAVVDISLYFDRDHYKLPRPARGFGRAFYRASGMLDDMAHEAGLTSLSEFESPDPLDTRQAPVWHSLEAALPTVEHLLTRLDPGIPLHRYLQSLRDALRAATEKGAKFYFLVGSGGGGTNARVEALRQGDMTVLN